MLFGLHSMLTIRSMAREPNLTQDEDSPSVREDYVMFNIELIRSRQEQRLVPARGTWNEAKKHLEEAIALAEAREREFREVSQDVQRRLEALDLVVSMAREIDEEGLQGDLSLNAPECQPMLSPPENAGGEMKAIEGGETPAELKNGAPESLDVDALVRSSSRPLFPPQQRSRYSLSILQ